LKITEILKPKSGAAAFFVSILVWGVGVGCFMASMNNFLSVRYDMDSLDRGWLEFFRELPGLSLVFILALMHRVSDWRVMRLGTMISMAGAALLLVPADKVWVTAFIMIWSLGEHVVMPVRSAVAMQVAKPDHTGQALGYLSAVMHFGAVAGSLLVALIFFVGTVVFKRHETALFNVVWGLIVALMAVSVACSFSKHAPNAPSRRPRLYFNGRFWRFYGLELFYGARKQIFMTFAPYVLIREYGFSTATMALLLGVCATVNIVAAPLVGRLADRWGYRNIMIWDTVILAFVCLLYGFAGDLFPTVIALGVICVNFLLDAVLSTTSLATNIYVRSLAGSQDELTSTLSTGISINHFIAILSAPLGGWVWQRYGIGVLFSFAAAMAICNSLFAMTLPKPSFRRGRVPGS
jgi:predicted MFS family arabinose efflux permease